MATAFWEPNATKSEAEKETLLTILLHPAPMNALFTSTPSSSPPPPPLIAIILLLRSENSVSTEYAAAFCFSAN